MGEATQMNIVKSRLSKFGGPYTHIASDKWTLEDALGYHAYDYAIVRFIIHDHTNPPLCISIQAPWEDGKTSLMRIIQKEIDPPATEESLNPVDNKQKNKISKNITHSRLGR